MAARVIHIGTDNCHRVPVLERAGYKVDGCSSVVELRRALKRDEDGALEAVLVGENEGASCPEMIREAKKRSVAPVVLFRETVRIRKELDGDGLFDMEVPALEPPDAWLNGLAALIARGHEISKRSMILCEASAAVREQFRLERQRSYEVRRKVPDPEGFVRGPKDDGKS